MKLSQAKAIATAAIKNAMALPITARDAQYVVPYLISGAGLGKTSTAQEIAADLDVPLVILSLAQYDYSEIAGWTLPNDDKTQMVRVRPDWMPADGKGIIFLDELPQAPVTNQNIAAQLVNERRVGPHKLPHGWVVMAAGNRTSDRAGTNVMPTHLRDRLMFLEIDADLEDTVSYFSKIGVSEKVRAYLRFRPEWLHKFDTQENACPSPRSWERVSSILGWEIDQKCMTEAVAGQVGRAASADFMGFLDVYEIVPDIDKLIAKPDDADIPSDPAVMFAVSAAISNRMASSNVGNCLKYMNRLPMKEFVAFAVKDALSRDPALKKTEAIRKYIVSEGAMLALS
jgi:hypothetical protein